MPGIFRADWLIPEPHHDQIGAVASQEIELTPSDCSD
jgi:hypothetical protein